MHLLSFYSVCLWLILLLFVFYCPFWSEVKFCKLGIADLRTYWAKRNSDSEEIEQTGTKCRKRNFPSVEQIQDTCPTILNHGSWKLVDNQVLNWTKTDFWWTLFSNLIFPSPELRPPSPTRGEGNKSPILGFWKNFICWVSPNLLFYVL